MSRVRVPREIRICPICQKQFEVIITSEKKFCNQKCRYNSMINKKLKQRVPRETRTCPTCGKQFEIRITLSKKYCSQKCAHNTEDYKKIGRANKGVPKPKNFGNKISIALKGKLKSKEHKENIKKGKNKLEVRLKISNLLKGRKNGPQSEKTKQKKREAVLKRRNYGVFYNPLGVEFFRWLDKKENSNGQYATNPREYQIIGYSLDYIDFKKKIIREYDEDHHFDIFGDLKQKDIDRQQRIQKALPDFKIERFKQSDLQKDYPDFLEYAKQNFYNLLVNKLDIKK